MTVIERLKKTAPMFEWAPENPRLNSSRFVNWGPQSPRPDLLIFVERLTGYGFELIFASPITGTKLRCTITEAELEQGLWSALLYAHGLGFEVYPNKPTKELVEAGMEWWWGDGEPQCCHITTDGLQVYIPQVSDYTDIDTVNAWEGPCLNLRKPF